LLEQTVPSVYRQHRSVGAWQAAHGQVVQPGAGTYFVHTLPAQYSPGEQLFLQAPQFVMSDAVLTHAPGAPCAPAQSVSPVGQPLLEAA
jgi:hypothetical protein